MQNNLAFPDVHANTPGIKNRVAAERVLNLLLDIHRLALADQFDVVDQAFHAGQTDRFQIMLNQKQA